MRYIVHYMFNGESRSVSCGDGDALSRTLETLNSDARMSDITWFVSRETPNAPLSPKAEQFMPFPIGETVVHAQYGIGTVKRYTVRPLRAWVTWDETGYTTCTNPERLTAYALSDMPMSEYAFDPDLWNSARPGNKPEGNE